jgi:hypothetical protein
MTSERPGVVFVRQYANDPEVEVNLLKRNCDDIGLPETIDILGLDPARQWYLYEEISPLCRNSEFACPLPNVARPCKKVKFEK